MLCTPQLLSQEAGGLSEHLQDAVPCPTRGCECDIPCRAELSVPRRDNHTSGLIDDTGLANFTEVNGSSQSPEHEECRGLEHLFLPHGVL